MARNVRITEGVYHLLRGFVSDAKSFESTFGPNATRDLPPHKYQALASEAALLVRRARTIVETLLRECVSPTPGLPTEVPAGHQRVRIAMAMTQSGQWAAWGCAGSTDDMQRDIALEGLEDDAIVHFIEADVPIPTIKLIEGVVT